MRIIIKCFEKIDARYKSGYKENDIFLITELKLHAMNNGDTIRKDCINYRIINKHIDLDKNIIFINAINIDLERTSDFLISAKKLLKK